ncbi:MAG: 4-hydroxybutyrate CoA-transferase, partial [Calditrichaeota bacterium]
MSWMDIYRSKVTDAKTAVSRIKSGERIYLGGGAGIPQVLVNTLVERASELENVEIVHMLHFGEAPYVQPQYAKSFVHNALFIGGNVRDAVNRG